MPDTVSRSTVGGPVKVRRPPNAVVDEAFRMIVSVVLNECSDFRDGARQSPDIQCGQPQYEPIPVILVPCGPCRKCVFRYECAELFQPGKDQQIATADLHQPFTAMPRCEFGTNRPTVMIAVVPYHKAVSPDFAESFRRLSKGIGRYPAQARAAAADQLPVAVGARRWAGGAGRHAGVAAPGDGAATGVTWGAAAGTAARAAGTTARRAAGTAARAAGTAARRAAGTTARRAAGTTARRAAGTTARRAAGTAARRAAGTAARRAAAAARAIAAAPVGDNFPTRAGPARAAAAAGLAEIDATGRVAAMDHVGKHSRRHVVTVAGRVLLTQIVAQHHA